MVLKLKLFGKTSTLRDSSAISLTENGYGLLPQIILIEIFQYFTQEELQKCIMPVCKQWRLAAEHPKFWYTLKFSGLKTKTSVIKDKISQYHLAEDIIIKKIKEPMAVLKEISIWNNDLVSLTLRHCPEISEDSLINLIVSCKFLNILDLKGTPFKHLNLSYALASSTSLSCINVSDNKYLTISEIALIIGNCHYLDEFHLSTFRRNKGPFLSDENIWFILGHMNYELYSLSLDCSTLTANIYAVILKCKDLRYLCLNFAYEFKGRIFELLWISLRNLEELKVRFGHQISDHHFVNLFENGRHTLSKLEVIDFTGCSKLSTSGLRALALCCRNLNTLIIRNCKNVLTIEGVLISCPYLEVLNVAFCTKLRFNNDREVPNLKELFVSDNKRMEIFANNLKAKNNNLVLRLCECKYNKNYRTVDKLPLVLDTHTTIPEGGTLIKTFMKYAVQFIIMILAILIKRYIVLGLK